jgi:hypothetical protein
MPLGYSLHNAPFGTVILNDSALTAAQRQVRNVAGRNKQGKKEEQNNKERRRRRSLFVPGYFFSHFLRNHSYCS